MYELSDTIVAVSSPTPDKRVIVRITGPETFNICRAGFCSPIESTTVDGGATHSALLRAGPRLLSGRLAVDDELEIDAKLYLFHAPHSYTGDDVAEIHVYANRAVTEVVVGNLLSADGRIRTAEPGEFTARAFLNGKMDLAQAEAVNEIIVSSNEYQLAAAEKLLAGRLVETTASLREKLMDCLGLIEVGLDFSGEDIEFISRPEAVKRLCEIEERLKQLLADSISCESLIEMPAVGIAGAPNAGKSSLLNRLLGKERSIVSSKHKTTRDVLTGLWPLAHCQCVLFDCAGLLTDADNILDELAQEAAVEALRNSEVVIFCADISKPQWDEDLAIRRLIEPRVLVPVATKCDLPSEEVLSERLARLNSLFGEEFLATSSRTGAAMELLGATVDKELIGQLDVPRTSAVALTARHKRAVTEAIEDVGVSIDELKAGNDEVAAMMMRAAHRAVCDIESSADGPAPVDEQILEQIFSRFCIGK
ncbi:MAG: tRNA modification GTPase [Planctomycetota bacterium]|jgi:tRNA modification GTPase